MSLNSFKHVDDSRLSGNDAPKTLSELFPFTIEKSILKSYLNRNHDLADLRMSGIYRRFYIELAGIFY